jgi:UDPglucose 6-dehydrogenase
MNILVIGAGYAGLITAVCFSKAKNNVFVYDKDKEKLEKIKAGIAPFFEKDLSSSITHALESNTLLPVSNLSQGFENSEIIFICVGTPPKEDDGIDLNQVNNVCGELAELIKHSTSRKVIVIRSTVVPGTTQMFAKKLEECSSKSYPKDFGIVSNPEFLRQGDAIEDFLNHNKVIIGSEIEDDAKKVKELYKPFGRPIHILPTKAAEMAKYVNNCMSATKISYINEIGMISKKLGIDINQITKALDLRIGLGNFPLKAGCGYGGSCLEKDLKALIDLAQKQNTDPILLKSTLEVNNQIIFSIIDSLKHKFGSMDGRKVGILGLSFKKGTDDIRSSRSIPLIEQLINEKALISVFDPKAIEKMKSIFPNILYSETPQQLVDENDAVVILADWDEFSELNYRDKIIIDGRNIIPKEKRGINYQGVCWP